jgi:hypothetical protein
MKWVYKILFLGLAVQGVAVAQIRKLNDFQVYPINAPDLIEPSGLTLYNNELFTVCDDANNIYRLKLGEHEADAEVFKRVDVTDLSAMNVDMEGLTVVNDEFFIVSEVHHKLVRLTTNEQSYWVPDLGSVYGSAFKEGLFQLYNAGLEAAAYLGNNKFLLAVERQPRGLIEVQFNDDFTEIVSQTNQVLNDSEHPLQSDRKPDLTGLFLFEDKLFALHRNAYVINELIKDENGRYQEGQSWSYEHIVKHPDYAYQDMSFGHAEGLAVDAEYFYLVLDNNRVARLKDPNDKRALLIKAKRK